MTEKELLTLKKNSDYWRGRFEILEQATHSKSLEYFEALEDEYRRAMRSVQDDIEKWYAKFADNNDISLADAKKLLNSGQLEEFKWSVWDYIKHGEEHSLDPVWQKKLKNASAKVHISRLEAIQIQIQQQVEILFGNQIDGIDKLARNIYTDAYYQTAFEIQKGFNIGWSLHSINSRKLDTVLSRPWSTDMRTFRDRCWTAKTELVSTVRTALTQSIMRGDSPDKSIKLIMDKFKVSRSKASRVVMTESAYFSAQAQNDCFDELDVEWFENVGTLDSKTCDICGSMDGTVYRMTDYEPGVTVYPFHPNCRCCTAPYIDDSYTTRIARDPKTGETYYVPGDMKYSEWYEKFVVENADISGDDKGSSSDKYTYNKNGEKIDILELLKKFFDSDIIKER